MLEEEGEKLICSIAKALSRQANMKELTERILQSWSVKREKEAEIVQTQTYMGFDHSSDALKEN